MRPMGTTLTSSSASSPSERPLDGACHPGYEALCAGHPAHRDHPRGSRHVAGLVEVTDPYLVLAVRLPGVARPPHALPVQDLHHVPAPVSPVLRVAVGQLPLLALPLAHLPLLVLRVP